MTRSARLSTAPSLSGFPESGQQSLQGASGASVGSTVGTGVAVAGAGRLDVSGVAAGELHAATRTRTAMRTCERATSAPFLIRPDCRARWLAIRDCRVITLTLH